MSDSHAMFLKYLPQNASILDAGCGVGRDAKYFLSQGYAVTAFDASVEMVKKASFETGLDVMHLTFDALDFSEAFDGVWAQASLLHVPYDETLSIYQKMHKALKPGGIFYASYKYGSEFMPTEARDFYNMDEATIKPYLHDLFDILAIWTREARNNIAPAPSGLWLHVVARKK